MKSYECFLLVCSITSKSSLTELRKFSKEINRSKCLPGESQPRYNIPCLIVINKIDLPEEMHQFSEEQLKIVTEELGCNYIYTSAKCNKYVSEAFEAICKMAIECRNERIEISRQLRGRNKNVGCKCSIM